ncbi:MAG TPA: hypothetical protein VFG29_09170 [Syntrophales bacterium]|nr:hypothetical protein [Syntrophales bacterium]
MQNSLMHLKEKNLYPGDARFDVVAIKMLPDGSTIELIQNAVELVDRTHPCIYRCLP